MSKNKKPGSEQRKGQLLVAFLSVVAVLLFVFCIKAAKTEQPQTPVAGTTATTTTQPASTATTSPSTSAPVSTTAPTTAAPDVTVAPTTTTTAPAAVDETSEILKTVSDSVNLLKSDKANFKGHKVQNINIHLVDSSVPAVNNIINGVIQAFVKEEILDYDFTNGISPNPEGEGTVDGNNTFPPGDKPFELTKEGVASAKKEMQGENTVYTVVIVHETSTLENPRPPHHNAGADTLDLSSVEIPIITLTKVDFDYPGATVSVTLNPDGEIIGYYERLEISGTGEGYGLGITGFGTIEGYMEEKWDIQWK